MKIIIPSIFFCVLFCFSTCISPAQNVSKSIDSVYTFKNSSPGGTGKYYMGREIAHIIDPSGATWLERDNRQQEENSNLAVEKMALKPDAVVADIGAGTGYYTFKMAAKVPAGKVYAVEVQDEMIEHLNDKKKSLKNENVEIIKGTSTSVNLPQHAVDLAIMVDVYHELEFPHEILQSIKNALKPSGKILLLEYRGEDPSIPIKPLHKSTVRQLNKEMGANGYKLFYKGDFLPIHHFLIYEVKK